MKTRCIRKAKARLKKYKVLEMPDTAKAEYLTRTFDESGVEILKKAIEQDIHKFSHIPVCQMKALEVMYLVWLWSSSFWAWKTLQRSRPDIIKKV